MALSNYDELKKSVIEWSHREDADLIIDDFIQLTETEMFNNDEEILQTQSIETTTTLILTDKEIDLPADYIAFRNLKIISGSGFHETQFRTPQQLQEVSGSGIPAFYTIQGNKIRFDRVPASNYDAQFDYDAEITPLSDANPVNIILTKNPNIYLDGCLYYLKKWADEPQDAEYHYTKFIKAIRGANKRAKKARYGIAPQMRIKGSTP
tara:strand:+ start:493 stop:1116 length:624 start_codon:yes stop_codon:yes gene_type:complete